MKREAFKNRPLFEMKRASQRLHLAVGELARQRGLEFLAGPQGRVLHLVEGQESCTIKDIEHKLEISKSVASNLVKRMEKNGFVSIEPSLEDKRCKYVRLTTLSKEKIKVTRDFFSFLDSKLVEGVSEADQEAFVRVMEQFQANIDKMMEEKDV